MRINQNISAMNTYSRLTGANNSKSRSLEKLSSGLRINRAGDDAAGLAISEKMRGQVGGLKQAVRNAQDGISLIQTAEGALNETHSILGRMRDLAVQSSSDTNTDADRAEIQKEIDQLASEMTRISNTTEFNTKNLLNGQLGETTFHIGANQGQSIKLEIGAMDAFSLGVARDKTVTTGTGADGIGKVTFGDDFSHTVADGDTINVAYKAGATTPAVPATSYTGDTMALTDLDITLDGTYNGTADAEVVVSFDVATSKYTYSVDGGAAQDITFVGGNATVMGMELTKGTDPLADESVTLNLVAAKPEVVTKDSVEVTIGTTKQTVEVDADATSMKITSGDFKGLSLDFTTKASGATAGTITTKLETETAEAATADAKANAPAGIDVSSQTAADAAITIIDEATAMVSEERSKLGSIQNRLDHTINNLTATAENLSAAESRIRDVDMAEEMMEFTKNNILSQAATSMLAQANQMPQSVLQLLQ